MRSLASSSIRSAATGKTCASYLTRTLGVKSLIMTTADHGHTSSGYPLLLATASFDTNDGHTYWQHDWENKIKAPMVNDPFNSTVVELSRTPVAGKPYTVSEVNNPFPNDWDERGHSDSRGVWRLPGLGCHHLVHL